jgi:hypothetical protein
MRILERVALPALLACLLGPAGTLAMDGRVSDAISRTPIAGAIVTVDNSVTRSDENGRFHIAKSGASIAARAYGYRQAVLGTDPRSTRPTEIVLTPFRPKALYLSAYGIGDRHLRQAALDLAEATEINALVIDVKGDTGMIPYRSAVPLAAAVGAQRIITVRDIRDLIRSLKERRLYLIARIVVFKDQLFATAHPELAVKTASGKMWHDREGLAWADPFSRAAWDYAIAVALEAAALGFDEIQFDYVRFPDAGGLSFARSNTQENRVAAISGFLDAAREALLPYNVFLSADLFGYVCWNLNDTFIGQQLEKLGSHLDYISPMLYPSGFQFGIPGCRNPVEHPREVVAQSLARAAERTGLPSVRFRPWLQAFKDYGFGGRSFGAAEIRAQIDAAEHFGSDGWMLWNPHNTYPGAGLKARPDLRSAPSPKDAHDKSPSR